ncbi:hypothetical protein K1T71_000407 [Dendrolimus kikuchii]|uniref:Uncharacterized protein n=1 Tax=Dendrolimus kikuchii TaxID=765133 RepID=A0ACC1DJS7_9NEOP|nr:hypothetical protein K1T71_000407 [Dendrolimus kikuchii]
MNVTRHGLYVQRYKITMYFILLLITQTESRKICGRTQIPLEIGTWRYDLKQMDSIVIENNPIAATEGQTYVYENYFPDYTIAYVNVYNLAIKTCGANASLKSGGIGSSSVLIVLHADSNEEIRAVIDIWGTKKLNKRSKKKPTKNSKDLKNMKSLYLFKEFRAVSHNLRMY